MHPQKQGNLCMKWSISLLALHGKTRKAARIECVCSVQRHAFVRQGAAAADATAGWLLRVCCEQNARMHQPQYTFASQWGHAARRQHNRCCLPLYSMPHFSFTMTGLPVSSFKNGFGLTGAACIQAELCEQAAIGPRSAAAEDVCSPLPSCPGWLGRC